MTRRATPGVQLGPPRWWYAVMFAVSGGMLLMPPDRVAVADGGVIAAFYTAVWVPAAAGTLLIGAWGLFVQRPGVEIGRGEITVRGFFRRRSHPIARGSVLTVDFTADVPGSPWLTNNIAAVGLCGIVDPNAPPTLLVSPSSLSALAQMCAESGVVLDVRPAGRAPSPHPAGDDDEE